MNELSVTEEETIRGLLQLGWSHRRVARETGHHRATIQRMARAMAIVAATEEAKPATDSKVAADPEAAPRFPVTATDVPTAGAEAARDPVATSAAAAVVSGADGEIHSTGKPMAVKRSAKPIGRSSCEAHRSFIEAEIAKGRNAVAIYQDLVEHHGYEGAYNAVKRFVRKNVPSDPKVSCRFGHFGTCGGRSKRSLAA